MRLPFTKTILSNGLQVIVHEDHHVPLVAISIWYHVGSKNERPGLTGLAHLFEHLMFEGAAHQPLGYFEPLQRAGAALNGSTSTDRTNYWEVVPRDAVELALWMEADRMGWLLPGLTDARFNTQRDVVLNERRQNYENRPYGLAQFALHEAVYPQDHPYRWPTIGEIADLHRATPDDARAFFTRYYHPGNASLAIAGDIGTDDALRMARSLFEEIPGGPRVEPVHVPDVPARVQRIALEDRVELPRLYLVWPTPALFTPADAALDLVAHFLATGRASRLYRRLIHDEHLAADVSASQGSMELGSLFQIAVTAASGTPLAALERGVDDAIDALAAGGALDDELERGRVQAEALFVYRLQTLGGFGGKADQLNAYNVYRGTPDYLEADLARYLSVTSEDIAAAARALSPTVGARLSVVPHGHLDQALPGSRPAFSQ
jgi:zinc protease